MTEVLRRAIEAFWRFVRNLLRPRVGIVLALLVSPAGADPAPSFWDPALHLDKPDTSGLRAIRFLTSDDYPPLDFVRADGELAGFNVEIARAICEELQSAARSRRAAGTRRSTRWRRERATRSSPRSPPPPRLRQQIDFTQPYYQTPGALRGAQGERAEATPRPRPSPARRSASIAGSAHKAYLDDLSSRRATKAFPNFRRCTTRCARARSTPSSRDGLTLAIWLGGESVGRMLRLQGRPLYREPVLRRRRRHRASARRTRTCAAPWTGRWRGISQRGVYAEIYRKYFPVGFY